VRTAVQRSVFAVVLAVLLVACGGTGGSVAATVDGERIERELLERMVRAQLEAQGVDPESLDAEERGERVEPLQRQMLTALIQFEILEQVADDFGVEISDEDLDAAFEEQVAQFGGEEAYQAETGMSEEEFRELFVATQVRVDALFAELTEDVGDDELREAYEAQVETRYATRAVRHILVETEEEADDVVEELEDGADFGELAGDVSQDPGSAPQGGEYGAEPRGQYVEEFDDAVWDADIGELVGPVETQFGFHVIEVTDEELAEFEDVRDELREELTGGEAQEAFNAIIESAFAETDVEVDSAFGTWDSTSGEVVADEPAAPEDFPDEGEIPEELLEQFPDGEIPPELMEQFEEFQQQLEEQGGGEVPGQ
jgi:parvulin-like peptidyl-prolyl isomerase